MSMRANGTFGGNDPHARSGNPAGWTHPVTRPSMSFKFHHVISWDCLRDTWQALLQYGQWDALEAFMTAAGVTGASAIRGKLHREDDLSQVELETVFERVSWPRWNIVQGPGERSDEGGKDIDLFTEGMSSLDTERHVTLGLLWIEMESFLKKVNRVALKTTREGARDNYAPARVTNQFDGGVADGASRLARAFHKMAKFKTADYLPWTHSMWDTVQPGFVNRQAIAVWDQVPIFRKTLQPRTRIGDMPLKMRCKKCNVVYERPNVPPGTIIWCESCNKQTQVDFSQAAT